MEEAVHMSLWVPIYDALRLTVLTNPNSFPPLRPFPGLGGDVVDGAGTQQTDETESVFEVDPHDAVPQYQRVFVTGEETNSVSVLGASTLRVLTLS